MNTEPLYFKEFREHINTKFDGIDKKFENIDKKFEGIDKRFNENEKKTKEFIEKAIIESEKRTIKAIEESVNELAITTLNQYVKLEDKIDELENGYNRLERRFDSVEYEVREIKENMATKEDIKPIFILIGKYEIRALGIEETLKQDHERRIVNLEKVVLV